MNAPLTKGLCGTLCLAAGLFSTGCAPWIAYETVTCDRGGMMPGKSVGSIGVSGRGSVTVVRDHGMVYLIGPDGPWRQHHSFYGIYFKEGPDAPEKFNLILEPDEFEETYGVTGKVVVEGRHVLIDVKYKDSSGRWKELPINGRRKIDMILPDDRPRPKGGPQAQ